MGSYISHSATLTGHFRLQRSTGALGRVTRCPRNQQQLSRSDPPSGSGGRFSCRSPYPNTGRCHRDGMNKSGNLSCAPPFQSADGCRCGNVPGLHLAPKSCLADLQQCHQISGSQKFFSHAAPLHSRFGGTLLGSKGLKGKRVFLSSNCFTRAFLFWKFRAMLFSFLRLSKCKVRICLHYRTPSLQIVFPRIGL